MELVHEPDPSPLRLRMTGEHGAELEPLFWAVLERACDLLRIPRARLTGTLALSSDLPLGAGLGASAAFCVNMARWFEYLGLLEGRDLGEFARTLENLFHGESSGVDIAVALSGQGLHFERGVAPVRLAPRWTPRFYISSTGRRGLTADAVARVKALHLDEPERARALDAKMHEAVLASERALALDEAEGLPVLARAVSAAGECFRDWGLAEGPVQAHLEELRAAGALAVKPTGSGGGGFVLSLWSTEPPVSWETRLIACSAVHS
jgi:mevalonate kinase